MSWIALEDVASAAVNSLELSETENAIVPIAVKRPVTVRDVAAR